MLRTCIAIAIAIGTAGPALGQQSSKAGTAADSEKKICKRYLVTGSLAQTRKVCKTKMEWLRSQDQLRETAEEMRKPICTHPGCVG